MRPHGASARMARQRHPAEEAGRPRDRRHRRRRALRRRDRGPPPGARTSSSSSSARRRASRTPTSSTSPPQLGIRETRRVTGAYQLSGDDVVGCASFADTIGVNGWPIEAHVRGRRRMALARIPGSRGFNQLPYRMLVPPKVQQPAGRRPLRVDDARGPVGGARVRRLLRHGRGGGHRRASGARRQFGAGGYCGRGACRRCWNATAPISGATSRPVMRGLDPTHPADSKRMDCRIKSGNDKERSCE